MARILIIDDESHIRKLYKEYFSREGHMVDTATSVEDALGVIKRTEFDLVVLDIELKDGSGLDVLKQLKANNPDLPIVLNSGYSIYKSDFHTWIADGYVLKSSDIEPLRNKIQELIGK